MPGRRNPLELKRIKLPPQRRQRPDPMPSDDALQYLLTMWLAGYKVAPNVQQWGNFWLDDLVSEKRKRVGLTPMQNAIEEVAVLTRRPHRTRGWSETHALSEVARLRGLDVGSLKKAWQRRKRRPIVRGQNR
jgi:hypothetical protein